jgi:divalent metal cation (Fe/Co/Zn/Cd) transporter
VAIDAKLSVEEGHGIANEARHQLLHHLKYLSNAIIHTDPAHTSGEDHHHIANHVHDNLPEHSH